MSEDILIDFVGGYKDGHREFWEGDILTLPVKRTFKSACKVTHYYKLLRANGLRATYVPAPVERYATQAK